MKALVKEDSKEPDLCPYCRSPLLANDRLAICKRCKTTHHENCWNINHRCTVFGCIGKKCHVSGGNKKSPGQQPSSHRGKIGRNARCPCGSGYKYKDCCLLKVEQGITISSSGKGGAGKIRSSSFLERKSR